MWSKTSGLKETLDKMAQANEVRWYGHVVGGMRRAF